MSDWFPFIAIVKWPNDGRWTATDQRWPNIKGKGNTPEEALRKLRTELEERDYRAIEWLNEIEFEDSNI